MLGTSICTTADERRGYDYVHMGYLRAGTVIKAAKGLTPQTTVELPAQRDRGLTKLGLTHLWLIHWAKKKKGHLSVALSLGCSDQPSLSSSPPSIL